MRIGAVPSYRDEVTEKSITSVDDLVRLVGAPLPRVANKARTSLHDLDRQ